MSTGASHKVIEAFRWLWKDSHALLVLCRHTDAAVLTVDGKRASSDTLLSIK